MVLGGEFPVEAIGKGLSRNLAPQNSGRRISPVFGFTKPWESAAGDELSSDLREKMIVRGRPAARKRREKFLMVMKLPHECTVFLEQLGDAAPVVKQSSNPGP